MNDEDKKLEDEIVTEAKDVQISTEEASTNEAKTDESKSSKEESSIKNDPTATVYEKTAMAKKSEDDGRNAALVIGILAIVTSSTLCLALVGLILGIIAIVKGAKVRKDSSAGLAGWTLGIISVVLSSAKIIGALVFISHIAMYSDRYMGHGYRMWY
jgi:uncharacterized membrane protein